jgi:hypothetical protein
MAHTGLFESSDEEEEEKENMTPDNPASAHQTPTRGARNRTFLLSVTLTDVDLQISQNGLATLCAGPHMPVAIRKMRHPHFTVRVRDRAGKLAMKDISEHVKIILMALNREFCVNGMALEGGHGIVIIVLSLIFHCGNNLVLY